MSARHLTDYFKGIAILVVLIDHYAGRFAFDYYPWVAGYAFGFLGFFFIFSGYGIFLSLEKRFSSGQSRKKVLLKYFYDRAVRILPFFWIALLLAYFLQPYYPNFWGSYPELYLFGFPILPAPGIFWFVTSIIQCYWLAPVFYYLIKKFSLKTCFIAAALAMLALLAASLAWLPDLSRLPSDDFEKFLTGFVVHQLFLGNIMLFFLGMMMPLAISRYKKVFNRKAGLVASAILLAAVLFFTRLDDVLFDESGIVLAPLYMTTIYLFCLFALSTAPSLPLKKVFIIPGRYSYSIYLFHLSFFYLVAKTGLLVNDNPLSMLLIMILAPYYIYLCLSMEKSFTSARVRLEAFAQTG